MHSVYLISLGCDKNRVDGEVMVGTLISAGFDVLDEPHEADAIIINTCGFIAEAVKESIDMVLTMADYKKDGDCAALIVVGCMAERYREQMNQDMPEIDLIIGVGEYENIADEVAKLIGRPKRVKQHIAEDPYLARLAARPSDAIKHIAYVKVSEGCDNMCTYCAIPAIRGSYRSREMDNVLAECKLLIETGAKEIVLVAQDTSLYGTDIYGEKRLPDLIKEIANLNVAGIEDIWIRLMYVYPEHITDELIDVMASVPQVCHYLDMPIQHSENNILAAMNRGGSKDALIAVIAKLRKAMPDIALRTTLMVGFPGETDADFEAMFDFVAAQKFDRMGVFPFSQEEGTPAATFSEQVDEDDKEFRLSRLMELQQRIHFAKQEAKVGLTLPVMIDEKIDETSFIARSMADAYEVDAVVNLKSELDLKSGNIIDVMITSAQGYDIDAVTVMESNVGTSKDAANRHIDNKSAKQKRGAQ